MKRVLPDPEGDDILNRGAVGQSLSRLPNDVGTPLRAVVLDGKWGMGRTCFLKRWVHNIRDYGEVTVPHCDAFAHDDRGEPPEAPVSALSGRIAETGEADTIAGFRAAAGKLAKPPARLVLDAALPGASELAACIVKATGSAEDPDPA
ncbi:MAG: P-loop NTPase fold protein [Rhodobacteraceae bacterium]|nr:P-loop NTPase fold protein [Paracoccaceae bacterium]